ncbi:hypothetical protein [Nocardia altamirensis]|uniref:hypothetical protein n=1 Tax=Nocardia altamirensis TaxID=472158 RepID=UPI000840544F|nr:hypothetical protein [Nocardia altamirensis]
MDILIIGRSRNTVDTATAQIRAHGFTAEGVIADQDALAALDTGEFGTLLIGGGVERVSRELLKQRAARNGVAVIEARRHGRDIDTYLQEVVYPALRERP